MITETLTYMLTVFGELSKFVLMSSLISIFGFLASGIFVYLYYRKFYGVTEAPKGWKMFFIGLILLSFYQLMKVPYTYKFIEGDAFLLVFLVFQLFAIGVLAYGLYLLKKEVEI